MSFNPKDKTVSVYLSKHNYSKAIKKKKGIISLLFLKSSAELINIEDPSDIDGEEDGLDGEEEFIMYAMPVGTVSKNDAQQEKDFYAFVNEQGL